MYLKSREVVKLTSLPSGYQSAPLRERWAWWQLPPFRVPCQPRDKKTVELVRNAQMYLKSREVAKLTSLLDFEATPS